MQLTVLGSNGTYGTPASPASGYLLQREGTRIWIDAGSGTLAALGGVCSVFDVDAVVLTHQHADHCVDVIGFHYALRYADRPFERVPVYAPPAVLDRLLAFLGREDHPITEALDFRFVGDGDAVEFGGVRLRFAETDHPVPTVAVRAEAEGRSLTYTSDTGAGGGAWRLATGTDLLLAEATYQGEAADKPWPHHVTAAEAGRLAAGVGASRLTITHVWPALDPARSCDEAAQAFGAPVTHAKPGTVLEP